MPRYRHERQLAEVIDNMNDSVRASSRQDAMLCISCPGRLWRDYDEWTTHLAAGPHGLDAPLAADRRPALSAMVSKRARYEQISPGWAAVTTKRGPFGKPVTAEVPLDDRLEHHDLSVPPSQCAYCKKGGCKCGWVTVPAPAMLAQATRADYENAYDAMIRDSHGSVIEARDELLDIFGRLSERDQGAVLDWCTSWDKPTPVVVSRTQVIAARIELSLTGVSLAAGAAIGIGYHSFAGLAMLVPAAFTALLARLIRKGK